MPAIELSEDAFRRLHKRDARLNLTPAQVIEHLLSSPESPLSALSGCGHRAQAPT